jgi:uncharacterized DUF497 family protein
MKPIRWSQEKNLILKKQRGVCFEDVKKIIENKLELDILEHPNKDKYSHQRIFVVRIDDYVYAVPFVETDDEIFLKTIFPNRKYNKQYS